MLWAAAAIWFSSRRSITRVWPPMKAQKSSAISRWASGVMRPMQGAEHLSM